MHTVYIYIYIRLHYIYIYICGVTTTQLFHTYCCINTLLYTHASIAVVIRLGPETRYVYHHGEIVPIATGIWCLRNMVASCFDPASSTKGATEEAASFLHFVAKKLCLQELQPQVPVHLYYSSCSIDLEPFWTNFLPYWCNLFSLCCWGIGFKRSQA